MLEKCLAQWFGTTHKVIIAACILTINCMSFAAQTTNQDNCCDIKQIEFKGATQMTSEKKLRLKQEYEQRCLGGSDIQALVRAITNDYVGNGHVSTRVSIPEQNLQSGTLLLEINEGKVEQVEHQESGASRNRPNILPDAHNKILNLRDLEQAVDNMGRLKSNNPKMHIKPGSSENTSIVVIENQSDKKWFVTTGMDNYGSKHKGQNELSTSATLEDIFGMSEIYSVGHKRSLGDVKKRLTRGYSGAVSVPYGYNTFTLSYAYTNYRSFVQATSQKFKNNGNTRVLNAKVDRVIHRDGESKTIASIGIGRDNYANYIADTKVQISSYKIKKIDLALKHQRKLNKSILGLGIDYTHGINKNYVEKFGHRIYPSHSFNKVNYDVSWIRPFALNRIPSALKFTTALHGQYSPNVLCGSEKISIGGFTSVRGFKESIENTDNGAFVRNEVSLSMSRFFGGMNNKISEDIEVFLAYDVGRFWGKDEEGQVHGTMSGGAIGVRNTQGIFTFDITLGKAFSSKYIKRTPTEFYVSAQLNI